MPDPGYNIGGSSSSDVSRNFSSSAGYSNYYGGAYGGAESYKRQASETSAQRLASSPTTAETLASIPSISDVGNIAETEQQSGGFWSGLADGAKNVGSDLVGGAKDIGSDAINGAKEIGSDAVELGSDLVRAGAEKTENWRTAIGMTANWATGSGPSTRVFTDDSVALALQDADVTNQARDYWYDEVNAGNKVVTDGVTNFRGERRLGGGNFGLLGLAKAGLDPIEQYVGSFGVEMTSDGQTLTYTISNTSSVESFAYGVGPEYERSTFGPGGNTRQTYEFSEPIDFTRLQP